MGLYPTPLTPQQRRQRAQQGANSYYTAATADLTPDATLQRRSEAEQNQIRGLAAGLSNYLRDAQVSVANAAAAGPQVIQQRAAAVAQPVNAAMIGAGGQAAGAPTGAMSFAALMGANAANALTGLAPAAMAQGTVDEGVERRTLADLLRGNTQARTKARADSELQRLDLLGKLDAEALQQIAAEDQSRLAWTASGLDKQRLEQAYQLDQAKLAQDRAGLAWDQQTDAARIAIMQQNADTAAARLAASIEKDRAKGVSTATSEKKKTVKEAQKLVNQWRSATTKMPGKPGSPGMDRPSGRSKYRVIVRWNDPPANAGDAPKPREANVEYTATSEEDAKRQAAAAYGMKPGYAIVMNGDPVPIMQTVDGVDAVAGGTKAKFSNDQVRGMLFNFLRASGWKVPEARNLAFRLVPRPKPAPVTSGREEDGGAV